MHETEAEAENENKVEDKLIMTMSPHKLSHQYSLYGPMLLKLGNLDELLIHLESLFSNEQLDMSRSLFSRFFHHLCKITLI
jgi:hypothetical protein